MAVLSELETGLLNGGFSDELARVYAQGEEIRRQRKRLARVLRFYTRLYGDGGDVRLFSAPGRTELSGNHTDHNHGRVLAASINLDAVAAAAPNGENSIRVESEGFAMDTVNIDELDVKPEETGKHKALVRGVCAGFKQRGYRIGGFNAATASDVIVGSGLSSSAAFEVLLATILNHLYNDGKVGAVEIAQIAQFAENTYFGKPCGLMDQTASSVGGFVYIDFQNPSEPQIEKIRFDFASCGYALCIVDTGGSHSGLTEEYAAVRGEMEAVAAELGEKVLRDVDPDVFVRHVSGLRGKTGDRAVLRAFHFYRENERVAAQARELKKGNFEGFLTAANLSGRSSFMYNQNVYTCSNPRSQPVSLALCLSDELLRGQGAFRVHGGGFAGTIQAFVPLALLEEYKACMNTVFGSEACRVLFVREAGGVQVVS